MINILSEDIFEALLNSLQMKRQAIPRRAIIAILILLETAFESGMRQGLAMRANAERTADDVRRTAAIVFEVFFFMNEAMKAAEVISTKKILILSG